MVTIVLFNMQPSRSTITDISFIGLIGFLIVLSVLSYYQVNKLTKVSDSLNHTTQVKIRLEQTISYLKDAETSQRGFLLTQDSSFLEPFYPTFKKISRNLHDIDTLIAGNAYQKKNMNALRLLIYQKFDKLSFVLANAHKSYFSLSPYLEEDKKSMDQIRVCIANMMEQENHLMIQRSKEKDQTAFITPLYSLLLSLFAIIIVTLVYFRLRSETGLRVEAQSAEARIHDFFMQVPAMLAILKGKEHVIEFANPLYRELINHSNPIGKHFKDVLPEAIEQGHHQLLDNVYRTGTSFIGKEMLFTSGNGNHSANRYINFIYQAFTDADDTVEGIMVFCYDVSEMVLARKKIEETVRLRTAELLTINEELRQTNADLEQFASVASHDLQEPLRKIKLFANILVEKDDQKNKEYTEYLRRIEFSAKRMIGLIKDLLHYSSLQDRDQEFQRTDINKVVENVKNDFDQLIEEKQATISIGVLPVLEAVPLQMNQLFYNLVSNALKFSRPGVRPELNISSVLLTREESFALRLDPDKSYSKIILSDNGIGFGPEFADKIFVIFQRLHSRNNFVGNGIGLAICKKVVLNHGGLIIPHSEEGKGASFEIILPLHQ